MQSKSWLCLCGLLAAQSAIAQISTPAGYIVGSIPLPGAAQGDVAVVGTSLIVGQGSFGAGSQSIVRRNADGTFTTLATGFNSLGGFAVTADYGLLFATDNAGELAGAATGDTLFAIADPRLSTMPVTAAGSEVAAPGSIAFAQAVAIGPDGEPYVGNASGGTNGTILRHRAFGFPPFVTHAANFGYTAGLVFANGGDLFAADVDAHTFAGRVVELDAGGALIRTVAAGLSGALDLTVGRDGRLLLSGGFTTDFSSSTIVAIDMDGTVSEFAHGFGYSSGLDVDPVSGRVYALDFGASSITTFTPTTALLPGGGAQRTDCFAAFSDVPQSLNARGLPTARSQCRDGSSCDRDGTADGVCTFGLGVCFNVPDSPRCTPVQVDAFAVFASGAAADPQLAALQTLVDASLPASVPTCIGPVPVTVPLRSSAAGLRPASKVIRSLASYTPATGRTKNDRDRIVLRCIP